MTGGEAGCADQRRIQRGLPDLLPCDKTPLLMGESLESEQCWLSLHYFVIPLPRGLLKYGVTGSLACRAGSKSGAAAGSRYAGRMRSVSHAEAAASRNRSR